ncbi:MAG: Naphthalene 1,2-dioxygenase/salicylate 5-hydroxylase systems, ferredoxin component [Paracidovorax wautersii]|uniref:Naphthalene 1,2-dioxygenase/salicylate 5-hydroxylase systems, ferredoxin component n=1 Tax=Paracidovorax wautersii TaxID=1177982 RepID=A0A7V8FNU8_9BURK|nr:MAG: Naphthalene 1,2-dioxygenase/salicylate 5-hydroxylase systems, ferredoxin component [Paracidovorax wautersii]
MQDIETEWTEVIARDQLPDDDVVGMNVNGRDVALYTVDGEVYASDNLCTHGSARLCDGFLEGHEIECPLHQGRFDVRDGRALCAPLTEGVHVYPVRVAHGRVYLKLM